jgi:hypothetical protein
MEASASILLKGMGERIGSYFHFREALEVGVVVLPLMKLDGVEGV